jgi:hypothetical protein
LIVHHVWKISCVCRQLKTICRSRNAVGKPARAAGSDGVC